uniref:EF-hand calcium-binding domain-containing protein 7-like n=1 Tax=Hirondellea gigas TaxID=1518452 RepID=A0A2P2HX68_9CRUS
MEDSRHKELHAAYLCVKSSVAEDLASFQEIKLALQYAGYNPSEPLVQKIWSENSPNGITFEEFLGVIGKMKTVTADDLAAVFCNVFGSAESKVTVKDFKQLLVTGDDKNELSDSDINYILQEANVLNVDSIDCGKLARVILQTINELKQLSVEKLEEKSNHHRLNSKTFTKRHHKANSSSVNGSTWFTSILKGNFYVDHPSLISHQYSLNINEDGVTVVKIEPLTSDDGYIGSVDMLAYIFREGSDGGRTFVGVTEQQDSEGVNFWQGELTAGNYLIIPFTSGCRLPIPVPSAAEEIGLITRDAGAGRVLLTRQFRALLIQIFDQLDLDNSGGLSRQEFNLYNWRTSGEEVQDDEWAVVQSNFTVHNNELTPEGFLDLHQLEAEDSGGAEDDLWLSLQAMGYNHSGQSVGCAGYSVSALSQVCNPSLQVCGLRSGGLLLDKAIVRHTMESSQPVRIKNMLDLIKYQHVSRDRAIIVLQNKSQRAVRVCVDASSSNNVISHRNGLSVTLDLPAKSAIVAHHFLPKHPNLPWQLVCNETLL